MKEVPTTNEMELLSTALLNDEKTIKEVYYWIKMFVAEIGWHYPLDLIWQYNRIMELNLPKGATILDAGAGNGMMQFILAGNGYNILSVDFSARTPPFLQSKLFRLKNESIQKIQNQYTIHLTSVSRMYMWKVFNKLKLSITKCSWYFLIRGLLNKGNYGSVTYIQADFSDLSFIPSNTIDAIVSTSAVEHNPRHESLKKGVAEFCRVLKPSSPMFITTSITDKECLFDEATKGYFYDEKTLKDIFKLGTVKSNFSEYSKILKDIDNCKFLKMNMPYIYRNNANCGMPYGIWNVRYLPVGIIKWKR